MNGIILLTVTLGLLMISGLGVQSAFAQTTVDNFDEETGTCDATQIGVGSMDFDESTPPAAPATVGDRRDCKIEITSDTTSAGQSAECMMEVVSGVGTGSFAVDSSNKIDCVVDLHYGDGGDLNIDWSAFTKFTVSVISSDAQVLLPLNITVTFMDADSSDSVKQSVTTPFAQSVNFKFSDYTGIDFSDIDIIWVKLDPDVAGDFEIDFLGIKVPVGGEFVGVDTTALLLAGAEMNSYWILPLVAVIGVGAFIYSRKRN